jgi:hypothetical protein
MTPTVHFLEVAVAQRQVAQLWDRYGPESKVWLLLETVLEGCPHDDESQQSTGTSREPLSTARPVGPATGRAAVTAIRRRPTSR